MLGGAGASGRRQAGRLQGGLPGESHLLPAGRGGPSLPVCAALRSLARIPKPVALSCAKAGGEAWCVPVNLERLRDGKRPRFGNKL